MKGMRKMVIPILKDDGSLSGTAFLFKKDNEFCYWLTCHHVVATLEEIRVLPFSEKTTDTPAIIAIYEENLSNPKKDIAVIKTESTGFSKYKPVKMGRVYPNIQKYRDKTSTVNGYLLGFDEDSFDKKNEVQIDLDFCIGNETTLNIHGENEKWIFENLKNPWNIETQNFEMLFLDLFGTKKDISAGLSGSPLFTKDSHLELFCVGMVTQSTKRGIGTAALEGVAIPYEEIEKTLGAEIPFVNYSDCAIVVLAGKNSEIKRTIQELDFSFIDAERYHHNNRECWKPFIGDEEIKELIEDALDEENAFYQMSSIYIDANNCNDLINFIEDELGGLLFIIDKCSLNIEELKDIIKLANYDQKRASYLFVDGDYAKDKSIITDEFTEKHMPRVCRLSILNKRKELCNDRNHFRKRISDIFSATIEHSDLISRSLSSAESKLRRMNAPETNFRALPLVSRHGR